MQLSYNVIKKCNVDPSATYTVKSHVIPIKYNVQADENVQNEEEIKANAQNILESATAEAGEILDSARKEAERIKKDTYEMALKKGYMEGMDRGIQEGTGKTREMRENADKLMHEAHRVSREYIDRQREEIIDLAIAIAGKIIGYEADINNEVVSKIVQDSMKNAVMKGQVIIRSNPLDYAALDCRRNELAKIAGEGVMVSIVKDSDVQRGGCTIETDSSFVDAAIDSQLQKIREALMG